MFRARFGLVEQIGDLTGTDGTAALTDCETQTFVQSHRVDELDSDLHVVARHHDLNTCREFDLARDIEGADEELRTIVVLERRVTATFIFLQDIDGSLKCLCGVMVFG